MGRIMVSPQFRFEGTPVPGAGYSPGTVQWCILCLLKNLLRLLLQSVVDENLHRDDRVLSKKTPF